MQLQQLLLSVISSVWGTELLGSHCRELEVVWLLECGIRGGIENSFVPTWSKSAKKNDNYLFGRL
jgi:hypothetical protein